MKLITRAELIALLRQGRKIVKATLYERQDFMVPQLGPLRDVTNEPLHHNRTLLKEM